MFLFKINPQDIRDEFVKEMLTSEINEEKILAHILNKKDYC